MVNSKLYVWVLAAFIIGATATGTVQLLWNLGMGISVILGIIISFQIVQVVFVHDLIKRKLTAEMDIIDDLAKRTIERIDDRINIANRENMEMIKISLKEVIKSMLNEDEK